MSLSTTTRSTASYSVSRHRNLSGPSATGGARPSLDNRALATPPPGVPGGRDSGHSKGEGSNRNSAHRRLDRSLSDVEDGLNGNGRGVNSSRYKTELCRPFEESGHCKYGDKCQFAHGAHELRNLTRHPKYKTERCRTYHTIGFCPYGPRCHFIHNEDENTTNRKNSNPRQPPPPQQQQQTPFILPPSPSSALAQRPNNLCGLNSLGSSFESVSTASSSSPGNLSPSHLTEDLYPSITAFSPSESSSPPSKSGSQDTESPSSVFNFPASDALGVGSVLTPLNIQTQQMYNNVVDMAALHISAVLNISQNQCKNVNTFSANLNMCANVSHSSKQAGFEPEAAATDQVWSVFDMGPDMGVFPPPSTSPVSSNSDDSMGSTGSLEMTTTGGLDNSGYLVNSPLELGRCMRLPIFNKLSLEQ